MKSKYYLYLSAFAIATVFASCQKEDGITPKGNLISITGASVGSHAESRADIIEVNELPSIKTDEIELNITETVTPMDVATSRAGEAKPATLKEEGFVLNGFVPYIAGGADLPFMKEANVTYNDEINPAVWQIEGGYKWIDEQDHTFWAHYGTPTWTTYPQASSQYSTGNFTYKNNGREDLMFAYTKQKYSTSSGPTDDKIKMLYFTHALAGVTFNLDNVRFCIPDQTAESGYKDIPASNRVQITNVSIDSYSTAKCEVTNSTNEQYKWTDHANMDLVSSYAPDCTMGFIIPQNKAVGTSTTRKVQVAFLDKYTFKTHTFTVDINFNTGAWEAGKNYKYSLSGRVILPDAGSTVLLDNLELNLIGWAAYPVITDIRYLKRFSLTWYGTPDGKGQSTFCGISIEKTYDAEEKPIEGKDLNYKIEGTNDCKYGDGTGSHTNWHWNRDAKPYYGAIIGWSWDTGSAGQHLDSNPADKLRYGTYDSSESYTDPITKKVYSGKGTAYFDVADLGITDDTAVTVWIVYYGQNKGTSWALGDVEIQILEYR